MPWVEAQARVGQIEAAAGGRLGVAVVDAGSARRIAHRADERFPCARPSRSSPPPRALQRVDAGLDQLDRRIACGPADLLDYAPVKAQVGDGAMSLADACAAAIQWSDNTAANLVLDAVGGPR